MIIEYNDVQMHPARPRELWIAARSYALIIFPTQHVTTRKIYRVLVQGTLGLDFVPYAVLHANKYLLVSNKGVAESKLLFIPLGFRFRIYTDVSRIAMKVKFCNNNFGAANMNYPFTIILQAYV